MRSRAHSPNMKLLLRELAFGPTTPRELAEVLHIDRRNVNMYLSIARTQKLVRVCGWEKRGVRVYALGPGKDVANEPVPSKVRASQYRARSRTRA